MINPPGRRAQFRPPSLVPLSLRRLRAALLVGLLGGLAFARPALALTMQEVVLQALMDYPTIRVAEANRNVAELGIEQAEALHWPTVDLVGAGRVSGDAVSAVRPRARLNLYASGGIEAQIEREQLHSRSLANIEVQTREDVAFLVVQAWLRVVRAEMLLDVTRASLARHEELEGDFQAIAEIDVGRRYDLIQARTRTEQVRLLVADREAEIALARAALARFVTIPLPSERLSLPEHLLPPPGPEDATLARIDQHPAVLAAQLQLDSAQANTRVARAARQPRLDLESTVGKDGATQILLTWPAFDRGADAAERAAVAQVGADIARLADARQQVAEDLRIARQEWLAVNRRAGIAEEQVVLANELALTYREQFKIGRRNLLDLLNAFNELFQAESAVAAARADSILSRLRIEYAAGRLVQAFDQGS